jgi:RNA polymerase-interacting CarD/CdnL/TRCF family regulator
VFHPRCGFGTILSLRHRDSVHPIQDDGSAEPGTGQTEDYYYDIQLLEGGTLLVPVSRADSVGLRRLMNGVETVIVCLCSPAQGLPGNHRERAAALRARRQSAEPTALTRAIRDLLAQSRGRALSDSEKVWLEKSCQRLSTEAALVDQIPEFKARAAIQETVSRLRMAEK